MTRGVSLSVEALGGAAVLYVLAFRLLNLGLMAIGTVLVWDRCRLMGWTVEQRRTACLLFAWCPLLIMDLVGSGHNDALLLVCILAAVWLHLRGAWPLAVAALLAGGLVKLSGFFLLPAYVVFLVRDSRSRAEAVRRIMLSLTTIMGLGSLTYLPYADPALPHALLTNPLAGSFGPSPALALRQLLADLALALRGTLTPPDLTARQVLAVLQWPLWNSALAIWIVPAVVFSLAVRDWEGLLRAWGRVLFSYLLIGAVWFMPWYSTWLVPVLALRPGGRFRRVGLLLAWGSTLFYSITPALPGDTTPNLRYYYVPAVIFLPPLLACAAEWRAHRRAPTDDAAPSAPLVRQVT